MGFTDSITDLIHGKAATSTSTSKSYTEAPITFLPAPPLDKVPEKQRKKLLKEWMATNKMIAISSKMDKWLDAAAYASIFMGLYASFTANPKLHKGYWKSEQRSFFDPLAMGGYGQWRYETIDVWVPTGIDHVLCAGSAAALTGATYLAKDSPAALAIPLGALVLNLGANLSEKDWGSFFGL